MNLSVTTDAHALQRAFNKAPAKVTSHLQGWISRTTLRTEREAKKQVPPRVDTGQTQSSIQSTIVGLKGVVRPTSKHALWVHEGRKPGRMPPFGEGTSLNSWAKRKGIPPFLVARSIARKGTKPHKFMDEAYRIVKPSADRDAQKTLSSIVRAI